MVRVPGIKLEEIQAGQAENQLRILSGAAATVAQARGVKPNQQFRFNLVEQAGVMLLSEIWIAVDDPTAIIEFIEDDVRQPFTIQELIDFGHVNQSTGWWFITRSAPGVPLFVAKYSPNERELIQKRLHVDVINPNQTRRLTIPRFFCKYYLLMPGVEQKSKGKRRVST